MCQLIPEATIMTNIRQGELHPFLTKIETYFFPRANRINRKQYILGNIGLIVAIIIPLFILSYFHPFLLFLNPETLPETLQTIGLIVSVIISVFCYYVTVRAAYYRLQDMNLEGSLAYKLLALILVLHLFTIINDRFGSKDNSLSLARVEQIIHVVYLLALFLIPGTKGDNYYGPEPKQKDDSSTNP
jgi:uncharacterized membrane protein YhaH (DUF805 family)